MSQERALEVLRREIGVVHVAGELQERGGSGEEGEALREEIETVQELCRRLGQPQQIVRSQGHHIEEGFIVKICFSIIIFFFVFASREEVYFTQQ